ncbi:ligand-gated channel [Opitutaceae bacterium TAV5]|nr:ligand-gated channel [Opitutaceae bacterium TAV5]
MSFSRSLLLFLLPAASLLAEPAPGTDATSAAPVKLDDVNVTADRPASLTVGTLDAARAGLALTPGGTEVIDPASYLIGRSSTVADTFAFAPGVFAQSRFGSDEARLSIRGSGLQRTFHGRGIRVLQDGVPVNLADGSFDMQSLEPTAAAWINVWRGANALAYGSSTLGGAIDYVSLTGRTSPALFGRLELGSWDYLRATFAGGGVTADGRADAYASFTEQTQDGFRRHADQNNQRVFANAGWQFSDVAETRLFLTAVRTDSELPGNLTKAQLETDPRQAAAANVAQDQHRDYDLLRAASVTTVRTGDTTWTLTGAWTYKDLDHPIYQVIDQLSNDAALGINFENTSDLFGRDNRLRGGVLFTRGEINAANYVNNAGRRGALLAKANQTATNVEGFAEDQFALGGGFTLVAGANASWNRRENDQLAGAGSGYDLDYHRISPKLGLRRDAALAEPGASLQFYLNASGSYEPPSFSETVTNDTARDAQTARTLELGTRGTRGPVRWDVSLYYAEVKNELLTLADPVTSLTTTVNADRTTHAGVEAGLDVDLLGSRWSDNPDNRLVASLAWTWGRFRFDDDAVYGNNTLAGLPPQLIRGQLLWRHRAGWYAGPTVEWVPEKTWIDQRNTLSADPYAIVGFRLGRRQEHGISWFVEARNLTDKRYAATTGVIEDAGGVDQAQFLPGDGRSVYAGLEYRW